MPTSVPPIITVAYEELDGSPKISFKTDPPGVQIDRQLKCAWADAQKLANQLSGLVESSGSGFAGTVVQDPATYPGFPFAYVKSVIIEPYGQVGRTAASNQDAAYQHATLTVTYATSGFNGGKSGDSNVDESLEPAAQFLKIPGRKLFWVPPGGASDPEPVQPDEAPTYLVKSLEYKLSVKAVKTLPTEVLTLVGAVNDQPVTSSRVGLTFAKGTLLYSPPKIVRSVQPNGTATYKADFRFTYRPQGWNKFFRAGNVTPQSVYDDAGNEVKPYEEKDFTPITTLLKFNSLT